MKERVETAKVVKPMDKHVSSKYRSCEVTGKRDECVPCCVVAENGDETMVWLSWDYATCLDNFNLEYP